MQILLAGDHDDLVHVRHHDVGLEEQWQVQDHVLMALKGALGSFPAHFLVNLGMGDSVQLLPLLTVLKDDLAEFGTINFARVIVDKDGRAKLGLDLLPSWLAGLDDASGRETRINRYHN